MLMNIVLFVGLAVTGLAVLAMVVGLSFGLRGRHRASGQGGNADAI